MKAHYITGLLTSLFLVMLICSMVSAKENKIVGVKDFALGVYWPWERTDSIAAGTGQEKWAFVRSTCKMLADSGINTIWLVNIDINSTHELAKIAGPMGIKLLPCLGEIAPQNCRGTMGLDPKQADFHEKALEYYNKCIPQIVNDMGEEIKYIAAWILCDEPTGVFFDLMEPVREIFAQVDPERESMAVTMWPQTPELIKKSRISTFCVDLYPFFAEGNPNGPHSTEASRNYFTYNTQRMVEEAGHDGRIGWVMPQCFNEIWGPTTMRSNGSMVALPGAFVNWRTPTLSEMRWQIWESIRLGAKGVLFYTLLGESKGNPEAKSPTAPEIQKLLVQKSKEIGVSGLLDQKGRPTEQFKTMASAYKELKPYISILRKLVPVQTSWLSSQGILSVSNFIEPDTNTRYAVIVNPDFKKQAKANITASIGVKSLFNLITHQKLELKALGWDGGNSEVEITLPAGDGMLLEIRQ